MWYTTENIYNSVPVFAQNMLVAWRGWRIYRERFGPQYEELARFLEQSERWDPEKLRDYQSARLRDLIGHAYKTVPHYRDVMDARRLRPSDIQGVDDLPKLPLLRKDDVRAAGERLLSSTVNARQLRTAWTSASVETPLPIRWDSAVSLMNHVCYMRLRRWAGVPFGRPYATLQGTPVVRVTQTKPPFWRHNPRWNQLLLSTLHMSDDNLPHYVRKMREFGAEDIEAYASCAYVLARFLESRGDHLPLRCVITTGEPLLPTEREVIEERFQTGVFDAYGQAERVTVSSECEEHRGHHLYSEYGATEIVDDEGNALPSGCAGLMAGTSLHNFAMPLIRYICGDVAVRSDESCSCGRSLPMLGNLTSRAADIVVTPSGGMVPPKMITWIVKSLEGVRNWQVIQERPDELRVLIVREEPVQESELEDVRWYVSHRLGPDVQVSVERVSEIERTSRGKSRHVISRVPLTWGVANRSQREDASNNRS
jgi:phenylacetate-CoA ligase